MSTRVSKASTAQPSASSSSLSASSTAPLSSLTSTTPVVPRLSRGIIIAYLSIIVASLLGLLHLLPVYPHMMVLTLATIYIGSHNSLIAHSSDSTTVTETMQTKDALMFPLIGSVVLFSLYVVFKVFPKEYVNVLIKSYFFVFGCIVLSNKVHSLLQHTLPPQLVTRLSATATTVTNPLTIWPLTYLASNDQPIKPATAAVVAADNAEEEKEKPYTAAATSATTADDDRIPITPLYGIAIGISLVIAVYYLYSNHWLCSNLFGIAFSIQGIELLSLGSYLNGAILLCGLFIYDIFWVFGTEVMVTVAKSFDAPIKLLFPQTSWEERPSMLGLGDIVIPGIFIALMLRYDYFHAPTRRHSTQSHTAVTAKPHIAHPPPATALPPPPPPSTPFFTAVLVSYFIGLSVTVAVMYYFKAAQPALLYLVPAVLGSSVMVAWWHGEVRQMFKYTEGEVVKAEDKTE